MTENQPNSDIVNVSARRDEVLQNTKDPLPWLIRTLRQQQEKVADACSLEEPRRESQ